jgi:hypothetical protein
MCVYVCVGWVEGFMGIVHGYMREDERDILDTMGVAGEG